ncbi:MAG: tetratricopeptide repeat protein [Leptolyngbyaceae cyanobacterium SL_5_9]|nr:tetratricopeptide repeat protein [Leptolyngbyaceae cyanobacterium SL_5_9]NJO73526.1 tetratricopeptide repeat protein [Leptolyngbyaceae cyanobacterium RM1_406_9]
MAGDRLGEGNALVGLGNLGNAHSAIGEYPMAADCYRQQLAIAEAIGDRLGTGLAHGNLGVVFHALGDYPEAFEALHENSSVKQCCCPLAIALR